MFSTEGSFALLQRQATMLAASTMVPKEYQNNVPNCGVALELSYRMGVSWFAVMQNLDVIYGRPSWRGSFVAGLVTNSGRYTPLQFKIETTGPEKTVELEIEYWAGYGDNRKKQTKKVPYTYTPTRCTAWARDRATGEVVEGPPVSYDMAIQEGWVAKDGSKWLTEMRELMLRYRGASFFGKLYVSDLMNGMPTTEELDDMQPSGMRDVTPRAASMAEAFNTPPAEPGSAPATESAPQPAEPPKPAPQRRARREQAPGAASEPASTSASTPSPVEAAPAEAVPSPVAEAEVIPPRIEMVAAVKATMNQAEVSQSAAEAKFRAAGMLGTTQTLGGTTDEQLFEIYKQREAVLLPQPQPEGNA